jgi:hypothetical protein
MKKIIVIDDPIPPEGISKEQLDKNLEVFEEIFKGLKFDPNIKPVFIMSRLAPDDPLGELNEEDQK